MSTSVAKLTFDLLPEHPSCRVTGLSSSLMDSFTIHMKSGLMVSIILPESNSAYALTLFISTYAVRHKSLLSSLMGLVIRPTGLTMWYWYAQGDSSASVITQIDTLLVSVQHLMTVCVYMAPLPHWTLFLAPLGYNDRKLHTIIVWVRDIQWAPQIYMGHSLLVVWSNRSHRSPPGYCIHSSRVAPEEGYN